MTVGIAVISREGAIVGGADRAITSGTLRMEPDRAKIFHFNTCPISVMWAGSLSVASEVITALGGIVAAQKGVTVEAVAHTAADIVATIFGAIAEREILVRQSVTRKFLLEPNCPVAEPERLRLLDLVAQWKPTDRDAVEFLFVGYDPDGYPRIYRVCNHHASDHSMEGYAAIGSGADLAEQILMRRGYTRKGASRWTALLLTYLAKVEAESDLYVGRKSNFFGRVPESRNWARFSARQVRVLARAYKALQRGERAALTAVAQATSDEFKRLMPRPSPATPKSHRATKRGR